MFKPLILSGLAVFLPLLLLSQVKISLGSGTVGFFVPELNLLSISTVSVEEDKNTVSGSLILGEEIAGIVAVERRVGPVFLGSLIAFGEINGLGLTFGLQKELKGGLVPFLDVGVFVLGERRKDWIVSVGLIKFVKL